MKNSSYVGALIIFAVIAIGAVLAMGGGAKISELVGSGGRQINTGGSLVSADIDTSAELATILGDETGTAGSAVFSVGPTFTSRTTLASASSTMFSNTGIAYFGGTATSTFSDAGVLTMAGNLVMGTNSITITGSVGATGARATKVWGTDFESSNMYTVGGTSLSSTFGSLASANIWSALNIFGQASSTRFSIIDTLYAGGTATTTINSLGRINVAGASTTPQRDIVYNTASCIEQTLTDAATVTWNLSLGSCARVTLADNRTLDITNESVAIGQALRLTVCQDGTGSRTLAPDAAILWAGGVAPTLTTTANKCDVLAGFTTAATGTTKVFLGVSANY